MIEVQRIARESQREVRDVVRGYREADLGVELAGAQGVLTAAGIDCAVSGEPGGLPAEVQSALGWVVRESTTNVLRHGDAGRCSVALRRTTGSVVLTVENDGAGPVGAGARPGPAASGGGSGLAGLRERLREVDGTLEAGLVGTGTFRVVAEVPLNEAPGSRTPHDGKTPDGRPLDGQSPGEAPAGGTRRLGVEASGEASTVREVTS
jgi:two-component system sensor histidine kinase DesK